MGEEFPIAFARTGDLRSIVPTHVHMLALTATATQETVQVVSQNVSLKDVVVSLPPSWPNITYKLQPLHKRNINTCLHTTTECYYQVTGGIVSTAILEFIYISSCESCHRSTYSPDLRWSMVWQRKVLEYIYEDMTINLNVDKAMVWRIVKLLRLVKWRSSLAQPDSQAGESGQLPM